MNIWLVVSVFQFVIILFLAYYTYSFAMRIIKIEDAVNIALDTLEEKYKKMSEILNIPVFFDSVEVRQVVNDIYECQKAIYEISISMGSFEEEEEQEGGEIGSREEEN